MFRCTELASTDTFLTVCSLFHGIVLHLLDATHYRDISNSSPGQFAAAVSLAIASLKSCSDALCPPCSRYTMKALVHATSSRNPKHTYSIFISLCGWSSIAAADDHSCPHLPCFQSMIQLLEDIEIPPLFHPS